MEAIVSLAIGYLFGCLNPAVWVGKKKNVNLRENGTGNLGATNTTLVLGRKAGYFVLVFDMLKSVFSYRLARRLFPHLVIAGLIAGIGVILGHCFPVSMHFSGGKGLASFGGLILAHDPLMFLVLLLGCGILAILLDYGVYLAVSASLLFPIAAYLRSGSTEILLCSAVASGIILLTHSGNLYRALTHQDPIHVRSSFKKIFSKNS